ncbi:hypothetical protein, partial [Pseudomonas syringae]
GFLVSARCKNRPMTGGAGQFLQTTCGGAAGVSFWGITIEVPGRDTNSMTPNMQISACSPSLLDLPRTPTKAS